MFLESAPSPVPIAVPILFLRLSAGPCDNPAGESTRDFIHDETEHSQTPMMDSDSAAALVYHDLKTSQRATFQVAAE